MPINCLHSCFRCRHQPRHLHYRAKVTDATTEATVKPKATATTATAATTDTAAATATTAAAATTATQPLNRAPKPPYSNIIPHPPQNFVRGRPGFYGGYGMGFIPFMFTLLMLYCIPVAIGYSYYTYYYCHNECDDQLDDMGYQMCTYDCFHEVCALSSHCLYCDSASEILPCASHHYIRLQFSHRIRFQTSAWDGSGLFWSALPSPSSCTPVSQTTDTPTAASGQTRRLSRARMPTHQWRQARTQGHPVVLMPRRRLLRQAGPTLRSQ